MDRLLEFVADLTLQEENHQIGRPKRFCKSGLFFVELLAHGGRDAYGFKGTRRL
jgi:hypothetical protein